MEKPMIGFGESETREILANCDPRDLRSHVIILRFTHKLDVVFRRLFVTSRKSDLNKFWLIHYSRHFTFKSTQKCTWYENHFRPRIYWATSFRLIGARSWRRSLGASAWHTFAAFVSNGAFGQRAIQLTNPILPGVEPQFSTSKGWRMDQNFWLSGANSGGHQIYLG
jgi:hypothetical protein